MIVFNQNKQNKIQKIFMLVKQNYPILKKNLAKFKLNFGIERYYIQKFSVQEVFGSWTFSLTGSIEIVVIIVFLPFVHTHQHLDSAELMT